MWSVSSATSFSLDLAHTLPAGDGSKTVCAQYKDAAGNESATYTDSSVLDTTRADHHERRGAKRQRRIERLVRQRGNATASRRVTPDQG